MKATTVVLTDEQSERLAEEARRSGVAADVLIGRALDAFLGIPNGLVRADQPSDPDAEVDRDSAHDESANPDGLDAERMSPLWYVGIGDSDETDTSSRIEELIAEEWGDWLLHGENPPPRRTVPTPDAKHRIESGEPSQNDST